MEAIFKELGLNERNGLYVTEKKQWKGLFPKRMEFFFENENTAPYAFFCIDDKPIILFYKRPENRKALFRSLWNFNEAPFIIIVEANQVEIFNAFKYLKEDETLAIIGDKKKLNEFSYYEMVTGRSWKNYQKDFHKNRVDENLLRNIRGARNLLTDKNGRYGLDTSLTNRLIGKCIFVRVLVPKSQVKIKQKISA